jgi:uncharacterized protein YukE
MAEGPGNPFGAAYAQVMSGKPMTFSAAGRKFAAAHAALDQTRAAIPGEISSLAKSWKGPAATGFGQVAEKVAAFIGETAKVLANPAYAQTMDEARVALEAAQYRMTELATEWGRRVAQPGFNPDLASWAAAAQKALDDLSARYDSARGKLTPIKADLGEVAADVAMPGGEETEDPDETEEPGETTDPAENKIPADGPPPGGGPADGGPPGGGGPPGPGGPTANLTSDDLDQPPGGAGVPGLGSPGSADLISGDPTGPGPLPPTGPPGLGRPEDPADQPPDAATRLQSFDPDRAGPPPSLFATDSPTTLTSASNVPSGPGAGPPPSGGPAVGPGGGPLPPTGPGSTLTSAGNWVAPPPTARRGAGRLGAIQPAGLGCFPAHGYGSAAEEGAERETWLLGDEEWDEARRAPAASIGRPVGQ